MPRRQLHEYSFQVGSGPVLIARILARSVDDAVDRARSRIRESTGMCRSLRTQLTILCDPESLTASCLTEIDGEPVPQGRKPWRRALNS